MVKGKYTYGCLLCGSRAGDGISLHRFPKDDRLEKWKAFCHLEERDDVRNCFLCSRHFDIQNKHGRLLARSVPCIYYCPRKNKHKCSKMLYTSTPEYIQYCAAEAEILQHCSVALKPPAEELRPVTPKLEPEEIKEEPPDECVGESATNGPEDQNNIKLKSVVVAQETDSLNRKVKDRNDINVVPREAVQEFHGLNKQLGDQSSKESNIEIGLQNGIDIGPLAVVQELEDELEDINETNENSGVVVPEFHCLNGESETLLGDVSMNTHEVVDDTLTKNTDYDFDIDSDDLLGEVESKACDKVNQHIEVESNRVQRKFRYPGDFTWKDMSDPDRAQAYFIMTTARLAIFSTKVKVLRERNRRLELRLNSLKDIKKRRRGRKDSQETPPEPSGDNQEETDALIERIGKELPQNKDRLNKKELKKSPKSSKKRRRSVREDFQEVQQDTAVYYPMTEAEQEESNALSDRQILEFNTSQEKLKNLLQNKNTPNMSTKILNTDRLPDTLVENILDFDAPHEKFKNVVQNDKTLSEQGIEADKNDIEFVIINENPSEDLVLEELEPDKSVEKLKKQNKETLNVQEIKTVGKNDIEFVIINETSSADLVV